MKNEIEKLYPLQFENIYKKKIWGTNDLKLFDANAKEINFDEKIGEAWLLCDNEEKSIVTNGHLKGKTISYVLEKYKTSLVGDFFKEDMVRFPLLIKHIICKEDLSVQVHKIKSEVMYSLEDSVISHDVSMLTKEEILKNSNLLLKNMQDVNFKKGNFVYVKSKTVHSLKKDSNVLEISNNSNDTYRLYDYNRERKLDTEEAIKYLNLENKVEAYENFFENELFMVEELEVKKYKKIENKKGFKILIPLVEELKLKYNQKEMNLEKYNVTLIPNCIKEVSLNGIGKYLEIAIINN